MKKPEGLGPAGAALWRWLSRHFDLAPCLPAVEQLCKSADVLAEARREYAAALAAGDSALALRWASVISKAEASYARFWRLIGLHMAEFQPPAEPADKRRK
jgi:hypothetical protein